MMFSEAMPEDVYKLMLGKGHIVDEMLRQSYTGNSGAWVNEYRTVGQWMFDSFENSYD